MSRQALRIALTATALLAGIAVVAASLFVPTLLLLHTDERTLNRWSQIGQAISPIGVFFSGIAFPLSTSWPAPTCTPFGRRREPPAWM